MLQTLTILDLAVVEQLELELHTGLSVLTGETGAGKSILLTALGLALGDRADADLVRPEKSRADIVLEFSLHDAPAARAWLIDNELDDEERCLIRRSITSEGRSKAYINQRPVNLQTLQELSRLLVEIHGQHAHLTLLNSEEQRRLLDQFARHDSLLAQLNGCYRAWKQANTERLQLQKNQTQQTEREELLRYQLDELNQLNPAQLDYAALVEEHNRLAHLEQILHSGQAQLALLDDSDEPPPVTRLLAHSQHALDDLSRYTGELNAVSALLNDAQIQIQEAVQQLRRFLNRQHADPQRLSVLDSQLAQLQQLARKHKITPDQLPALAEELAQTLDSFSHNNERLTQLETQCQQLLADYQTLAAQLAAQRQQQAAQLQAAISAMLKELGMPHGEFFIRIDSDASAAPKLNGADKIEFLVSTNPGLPAKPLSKIASGGELSRMSLAIQVVTSNDKTTPTLIFDEVDSGIGGAIAEVVGQKLRRLSHNRQVLCVTHLPQVAAQAHQHLFVAKNQQATVTASTVHTLSAEQRITEIARMLGGVQITENTRAHAAEMLSAATDHAA